MLTQLITNAEQRKRCVEAIRRLSDSNTGLLLIVAGDVASGKTCFTRALADVLRENGKRVKVVDVAMDHPNVDREDVVDVKEGVVVIYEIYPNASIDISDDEGLKKRSLTIRLEECFLGEDQRAPSVVEEGLKQDFRRFYASSLYVVVDGDDMTTPRAICSTRDDAIEMAERAVKDDWNGQRHIPGDAEVASVQIFKIKIPLNNRLNHRVERGEMMGDLCWDALTAVCEDCCAEKQK